MGSIYVVATPIGNLKDMTPRAIETLKMVDIIAVEDTRHTIKLMHAFDIHTKMISYHKFNESKRSDELINDIKTKNINIALVSDAGTPCISDPGYILIKKAREEGINVYGISGPSAIITALSISGINTDRFAFYGFLPTDNKKVRETIEEIKALSIDTIVLYESPRRIVKLAELINKEFPNSIVCFSCDLTKLYEKSVYGNITKVLEELKENPNVEKGEYTVVIYKSIEDKVSTQIDNPQSIESMLVDIVIKEQSSLKDAVNMLKEINPKLNKKEIYDASLNLKKIFGDN